MILFYCYTTNKLLYPGVLGFVTWLDKQRNTNLTMEDDDDGDGDDPDEHSADTEIGSVPE